MEIEKANRSLEELGYTKKNLETTSGKIWGVTYSNPDQAVKITFGLAEEMIKINSLGEESIYLTKEEIDAIGLKCQEFNWH